MSFAFDEALKDCAGVLPGGLKRAPRPTWKRFEASGSLLREKIGSVRGSLLTDPHPKSVAVLGVSRGDAGMAFTGREALQAQASRVPGRLDWAPSPASKAFQTGDAVIRELAFTE
jgi:hypothetical protein